MHFLIHDASVLIDLINGGLLDEVLRLSYIMETTDFVRREITDPDQRIVLESCISDGKLSVIYSVADHIPKIVEIQREFAKLSISDCSVIYFAGSQNGIIISGDKILRNAAKSKKLEVHGTLWAMDQLVEKGLIGPTYARDRLLAMIQKNNRLPRQQCESLIEKWRKLGG